jgi:hypothetical protein
MSDDWTYLSHKIWKKTSDTIENVTKPLFMLLSKYVYYPVFGMFDPSISNMYGVDIRPAETQARDKLSESIDDKYKSKLGTLGDILFYLKKSAMIPWDLKKLFSECVEHSVEVEKDIKAQVTNQNLENLKRKLAEMEAQKAELAKLDPKSSKNKQEAITQLAA